MMKNLMCGAENMFLIIVVACIIVFVAMAIDLVSGLNKAKQRGEVRSSYGLSRSLSKFIMYEGGMLIASGVDLLMHFSKLLIILHFNALYGIPVITCMVGIFLLIIEGLSVKEKADDKTKTEISRVEQLAAKMINKDDLVKAFTDALITTQQKDKNG